MASTPIYGLWRVVSSTDSIVAPGMTLTFTARPDGLAIESLEGTGSTTPWLTVRQRRSGARAVPQRRHG